MLREEARRGKVICPVCSDHFFVGNRIRGVVINCAKCGHNFELVRRARKPSIGGNVAAFEGEGRQKPRTSGWFFVFLILAVVIALASVLFALLMP